MAARIERIYVEGEEDGWELVVETDDAVYRFNVHGLAGTGELDEQLAEISREIGDWVAAGREAAAEHQGWLDEEAARDAADDDAREL